MQLIPRKRIVYSLRNQNFVVYFICRIIFCMKWTLLFMKQSGIPADFIFPTRENLKKEVEGRVTHLVKNLIDTKWDKLLLKYQNQRDSLFPNINRTQVQETSKRYLKAKIKPEELFYSPKFSFAKMQVEYTDVMFLYCLNHHEKAVQMIADKWLKESLWEISQKRIYLGCVREEMEELQKKAA